MTYNFETRILDVLQKNLDVIHSQNDKLKEHAKEIKALKENVSGLQKSLMLALEYLHQDKNA